ncbi:hypothetical protein C0216_13710 [Streptomyces globosus]|uniref:Uncharacterized protein n=1 Tax=Streptomyces globosus TaxID=68209 RepID=A0A344U0E6_9ACTN|nr:hypothetical protein [Streptomyces globosus]AXE24367.1 hypothetical protein C0216_13710 [Streptomyces globosus]
MALHRRRLLGSAPAAVLAAAGARRPPAAGPSRGLGCAAPACGLGGRVVLPGGPDGPEAQPLPPRHEGIAPAAVACPARAGAACPDSACRSRVPVAPRGGVLGPNLARRQAVRRTRGPAGCSACPRPSERGAPRSPACDER